MHSNPYLTILPLSISVPSKLNFWMKLVYRVYFMHLNINNVYISDQWPYGGATYMEDYERLDERQENDNIKFLSLIEYLKKKK